MSRLTDIEAAIDALPPAEKQELLLYLAARLRGQRGQLPPARRFPQQQVKAWIDEDEADMRRFRGDEAA